MSRRAASITLCLLAAACAAPMTAPTTTAGQVLPGTPDSVNLALARKNGRVQAFRWETWSKATFERARRERKSILLHGAAVWCHWCHVMEQTTYRDPEIGKILRERFVAIRVDVDQRPDIEERYGDWGWPATIVLSPDAEEVGKYRGYLPAEELREILASLERADVETPAERRAREPGPQSASLEALPWVARRVLRDMDAYYDSEQGGWGMRQKAPLGDNAVVEARRARAGDARARSRLSFSLHKQRALIDPVWGGIYQYSAGSTWNEPHFEKLIAFQAPNIEAYARAYELLRAPVMLNDARRIADYVERFLKSDSGAYHPTQDADVGAHDESVPFVDGNVYYRKNERERLALGVPWVDPHVYAAENGAMIAALVALHAASGDPAYLQRARRVARVLGTTHLEPSGAVRRDPGASSEVRFVADAAGLGRGLALLCEVGGDAGHREASERIARWMIATLEDPATGAFFAQTPDPDAAGVFAERRRPFAHNVTVARHFAALARLTGDASWRERARRVLAAISTPRALDEQGRMVGAYLLALDEAGISPW